MTEHTEMAFARAVQDRSAFGHNEGAAARKHRWRLELEHAYRVEHVQANEARDAQAETKPTTSPPSQSYSRTPSGGAPETPAEGVPAGGSGSAAVDMSDRGMQIGARGTQLLSQATNGGVLTGAALAREVATARPHGAANASAAPSLPTSLIHAEAMRLVHISWNDGAAYVYVPAGLFEEARVDVAVRILREALERSGVRVACIVVAGATRWTAQPSLADHAEPANHTLNRTY